jgi:hypothetical protein
MDPGKALPEVMPWGWKHAYLDDPDGHEVSLDWADKSTDWLPGGAVSHLIH